ncbi:MAG TPA: phage holin family protein [Burkholderiaceae bacterium]|nr:phage holin family protein [Burkholderiaceae bacterium]HYB51796.1 phage holin family protein [Burkholderiaceae bacterium]
MAQDAGRAVGRVRGFAASSIRVVRTRLELLGVEIQEEKARVIRDLLIAVAALNLILCGLLLVAAWIVLSTPAEQRGVVLGIIALVVLLLGVIAFVWLLLAGGRRKPLFDATVTVLKGDEDALDKTVP